MADLPDGRLPSILVIDDDKKFREKLVSILNDKQDMFSMAFESGDHALRFVESQAWSWVPKVIITDIAMEGVGGYQLMKSVTAHYPKKEIPMIVVSKLTHPDYQHEAAVVGADAFLPKPLHISKLLETIKKVTTKEEKILTLTEDEEM